MTHTFRKSALIAGLLFLSTQTASAQKRPAACFPAENAINTIMVASVTGCPFSALMETTQTQTLADGTHIQRKSKMLIYRDSSGRIRYDHYLLGPADQEIPQQPSYIEIMDPVAGFTYWLRPDTAVASRSRSTRSATPKPSPRPPTKDSASGQTDQPKYSRASEELGTHFIAGDLASGRRETITYPVGAEGNDRLFVVVSEIWESSDLNMRLLMKNADPRSGDLEQRVTDLARAEPDPSLFQVPPDYTINGE